MICGETDSENFSDIVSRNVHDEENNAIHDFVSSQYIVSHLVSFTITHSDREGGGIPRVMHVVTCKIKFLLILLDLPTVLFSRSDN